MDNFGRYGIYFTPPPGALAEFGAAWLGWDVARGRAVAHPDIAGLPLPVSEITATPRKYGFHATLKPPFRLAEGRTAKGLQASLEALCQAQRPVALDGLALTRLGSFLALTPVGDVAALRTLAARLVAELDPFRGPQTDAELAKRRASGLTVGQDQMLQRWGYPYVMDEFRFHMTLSGKLGAQDAEATRQALAPRVDAVLAGATIIDAVTLVGEGKDGMFREITRMPLVG